jgi:hypothetical protein
MFNEALKIKPNTFKFMGPGEHEIHQKITSKLTLQNFEW